MGNSTPKNLLLSFGQYTLSPTRHTLSGPMPKMSAEHVNGNDTSSAHNGTLKLTPTEFRLLFFLFQNEGLTVTRDEIQKNVWEDSIHIRSRAIDKHIHMVKAKLLNFEIVIECIYGKGYRLCLKGSQPNQLSAEPKLQLRAR